MPALHYRRLLSLSGEDVTAGDSIEGDDNDTTVGMATSGDYDGTTTPSKMEQAVEVIKTNAEHLLEKVPRT
jgi:hypothetical protein